MIKKSWSSSFPYFLNFFKEGNKTQWIISMKAADRVRSITQYVVCKAMIFSNLPSMIIFAIFKIWFFSHKYLMTDINAERKMCVQIQQFLFVLAMNMSFLSNIHVIC